MKNQTTSEKSENVKIRKTATKATEISEKCARGTVNFLFPKILKRFFASCRAKKRMPTGHTYKIPPIPLQSPNPTQPTKVIRCCEQVTSGIYQLANGMCQLANGRRKVASGMGGSGSEAPRQKIFVFSGERSWKAHISETVVSA